MSSVNMEYKLGQVTAELDNVKQELDEVKDDLEKLQKSLDQLVELLTKGKGIFIGLLIAASSAGAMAGEIIDKIKEIVSG
jgi:archaellum component FlaC